MTRFHFLFVICLLTAKSYGQQVIVTDDDSYTGASSAMLDIKSTTKGFLPPRLTTSQRTSISSPAEGLLVFDSDFSELMIFRSGEWHEVWNTGNLHRPSYGEIHLTSNLSSVLPSKTWIGFVSGSASQAAGGDELTITEGSSVSIPDKIVIGSEGGGIYMVQVYLAFTMSGIQTDREVWAEIHKNGVTAANLTAKKTMKTGTTDVGNFSGLISLAAGDYLELWFYVNHISSTTFDATSMNFMIYRIN
ncbi:MAG: hypothetical protein RIB71_14125 [Imperialibacter sp.]|uniref:hypothetical protein n=1 Tax=Imperialibacter sp. TaxID=2038411 RepID=UPI0032EC2E1D